MQIERETDDWWENNSSVVLKTLKVFDNVIEDIKEANLLWKKRVLNKSGQLKQG